MGKEAMSKEAMSKGRKKGGGRKKEGRKEGRRQERKKDTHGRLHNWLGFCSLTGLCRMKACGRQSAKVKRIACDLRSGEGVL